MMNEKLPPQKQPLRFSGMETGPGPRMFEHQAENLPCSRKPPSVRLRLNKLMLQSLQDNN